MSVVVVTIAETVRDDYEAMRLSAFVEACAVPKIIAMVNDATVG